MGEAGGAPVLRWPEKRTAHPNAGSAWHAHRRDTGGGNKSGDTNAAHVKLTDEGYEVSHVVKDDSISDVLKYVEYQPEAMVEAVRRQAERAVQSGRLSNEQMRTLMQHYEQAFGAIRT